jgi:hypothetical protein
VFFSLCTRPLRVVLRNEIRFLVRGYFHSSSLMPEAVSSPRNIWSITGRRRRHTCLTPDSRRHTVTVDSRYQPKFRTTHVACSHRGKPGDTAMNKKTTHNKPNHHTESHLPNTSSLFSLRSPSLCLVLESSSFPSLHNSDSRTT